MGVSIIKALFFFPEGLGKGEMGDLKKGLASLWNGHN